MTSFSNDSTTATILVVDDERTVLKAVCLALERLSFRVLQAKDGEEALALLDRHCGETLSLLMTDVDMPGCNGQELASYARQRFRGIKVLFTSGKPQRDLAAAVKHDVDALFMEKPFAAPELVSCVRALLEG